MVLTPYPLPPTDSFLFVFPLWHLIIRFLDKIFPSEGFFFFFNMPGFFFFFFLVDLFSLCGHSPFP